MLKVGASKSLKFAILSLVVLTTITTISALILSSSPSHAETSSVLASVTVPDVCTIAADNSSTAHTDTVGVGEYKANIGETVFNITCNDNNGYSIYAVGYSNNTVGNTNLIGTTNGATIPTGTSTTTGSSAVSNWAMKLTPVTGTFPATILNGYDNYHTVPSTAEKVATRTSSIDLSANSQVKTTYAVSISPSQAKGDYTGKVKYTVVHPNYSNADGTLESYPVTLSFGANTSSIVIDGISYTSSSATPNLEYGTHTISATFPEGYKLNSWSSTGSITVSSATSNPTSISVTGTGALSVSAKVDCAETITGYMQDISSANAYCDGASGTLTDRRDNKTYTVKKLADGKLWMTENLAIDLTAVSLATLQGNTNASNQTLTYLKNGGGSSPYTNYAVAAADSNNYYDRPAIATSGTCNNAYCVNNPSSGNWKWDAVTSATINGVTSKSQSQIGVYYNYCAASAGSYCYSLISSSGNATEDICPYGWRLPTGGSSGEFQALYTAYSSNYTNLQTALSTPLSGYFGSGKAYDQGNYGYFWSSTWYNNPGMYFLKVDSTSVDPSNGLNRNYGRSVRCVFGS